MEVTLLLIGFGFGLGVVFTLAVVSWQIARADRIDGYQPKADDLPRDPPGAE